MSLRERDNKMIVKSNFVISCLTFKGSISTKFKGKEKQRKNKSQDKCLPCGKKDHLKKECLKFLEKESSMHHSLLVKSFLMLDSTNSWWIDSGATDHVCNSL